MTELIDKNPMKSVKLCFEWDMWDVCACIFYTHNTLKKQSNVTQGIQGQNTLKSQIYYCMVLLLVFDSVSDVASKVTRHFLTW